MIKIIRGFNTRFPIEELRLDSRDGIALTIDGSEFDISNVQVTWSGLQTGRDGQRRINTTRDNGTLQLKYNLNGGNGPARLAQLQRDLYLFEQHVKDYEQHGIGEPVWLAYRTQDNLDLPEPVFGQFSTFVRILHINLEGWGQSIMNPGVRSRAWNVACTLTVAPWAEGHAQDCGRATGFVKVEPTFGVVTGRGSLVIPVNLFPNPSCVNLSGWTNSNPNASSFLNNDVKRSQHPSVRYSNRDTTTEAGFLTTLDVNSTNDHIVAVYVRMPDGRTPTASDFELVIAGSTIPPQFIDNLDGWHRAWAIGAGAVGNAAYGLTLNPGREIFFTDFILHRVDTVRLIDSLYAPRPFLNGDHIGCDWSGTPHNSTSETLSGGIDWPLTTEFNEQYTISCWVFPVGNGILTVPSRIWRYATATEELELGVAIDTPSNTYRFVVTKVGPQSQTITFNANGVTGFDTLSFMHIAVVQDATTLGLYINGVLRGSQSSNPGINTHGTFSIGGNEAGGTPAQWATDALRIWEKALPASDLLKMHTQELPVKQQGDILGMPPFVWTNVRTTSGGVLENIDDSSGDYNKAVVGGVGGDLPAEIYLRYTDADGGWMTNDADGVFYVARQAVPYTRHINHAGLWWHTSFTNTADGGDEYYSATITHQDRDLLKGICQMILGFVSSPTGAGATHTYQARSGVGNQRYPWSSKSYDSSTLTSENVLDIGDVIFQWPDGHKPNALTGEVFVSPALTGNWTVTIMLLLPRPVARISGPAASNGTISVLRVHMRGTEVWGTEDDDTDYEVLVNDGDPIDVLPDRYNWLIHFNHNGNDYAAADNVNIVATVTPRFNLPGGPIA